MSTLKSSVLILSLGLVANAFADEVSADDAARAASAWAKTGATLGARLGTSVDATSVHTTSAGVTYYAVKLREGGTVFTSADTELEPIVAFTGSSADFATIDETSPLWALLERDSAVRQAIKAAETQAAPSFATASAGANRKSKTARKWAALLGAPAKSTGLSFGTGAAETPANSVSSLSDVRVDKLLKTKWGQTNIMAEKPDGTFGSVNIGYNFATPLVELAPGVAYHCVPGCTAVAISQLMYYHRFPTDEIPSRTYTCKIDDVATNLTTHGGRFDWANMITEITDDNIGSITDVNRQALGYLMSDVGIALKSEYSILLTIAYPYDDERVLKDAYGYRQAITFFDDTSANEAYNGTGYVTGRRGLYDAAVKAKIVYANFDAGLPVLFGIYGYPVESIGNKKAWSGHAVVGDGYGFNTVDDVTTAYVHINLGWNGQDDTWYNIPEINTATTGSSAVAGATDYTVMSAAVYNVFPDKTGLILSGRVTDPDGKALSGVTVRALSGSTLAGETQTNEKGIYSFVLSAGTYSLEASVGEQTVGLDAPVTLRDPTTTYYARAGRAIVTAADEVGNSWGNDIVLAVTPEPEEPSEYGDRWFDADIARYRSWPTDGTDYTVAGAGTWSGTTYAELVCKNGANTLDLVLPIDGRVRFRAEQAKAVTPKIVTIRTSVWMPLFESESELPMEPAKCALACATVDGTPTYFGLARDSAGSTNVWRRLTGAVPNTEDVSELVFEIKKENGIGAVRYSVDGQVLKDGENAWIEIALGDEAEADDVSEISYRGDGSVSALAGYVECATPTPEYPEVIVDVVGTNQAIRAWIEALYQTEDGKAAVKAYAGNAATLRDCYLVNILPEAEPEIRVSIPALVVGTDGKVKVDGELSVHGAKRAAAINGTIRLYHAIDLKTLPATTESVDLGNTFPIPEEKKTLDLNPVPVRFLRLKVE